MARFVSEGRDEAGLAPGAVVVIDEASMVGTRHLAAVSDLVEQVEGKLILIGDDHQLPEIDAGGLFRALTNRLPAVELTDNIRQRHEWERVALAELRDGSIDQAIDAYRRHQRLIVGQDRDDMIAQACRRLVLARHRHRRPHLRAAHRPRQRHRCRTQRTSPHPARRIENDSTDPPSRQQSGSSRPVTGSCAVRIGHRARRVNGDLGTVDAVNPDSGSLTVRLDRDPETRVLPSWYLDDGHVDYGYALTGHKAQGVTTSRTFTVITGGTDREWAYVALSRGRQANTLYLANPEPGDEQCTHLTHPEPGDPLDALVASLGRRAAETAAIDHVVGRGPPSRDVAERAAWIVARRRAEHENLEHTTPGIGLVTGR